MGGGRRRRERMKGLPGQNLCIPDDHSQARLGGIPYQTGLAKITHLVERSSITDARAALSETSTQEGLGPVCVGENCRGSQAQSHVLMQVAVPTAGPFTAPPWDTSLPTYRIGEYSWSRAHLGGAFSVTFTRLAFPSVKQLTRPYHFLNTHLCQTR